MIDGEHSLRLFVNRIDYGIAAVNMPSDCYGIVDLYGQCEQVCTVYYTSCCRPALHDHYFCTFTSDL